MARWRPEEPWMRTLVWVGLTAVLIWLAVLAYLVVEVWRLG